MASGAVRWTPTQRRILAVLADGNPHTREELRCCLNDDLGPVTNLWAHVCKIRAQLRPRGEDIVCVFHLRKVCYRHVRLLNGPAGAS